MIDELTGEIVTTFYLALGSNEGDALGNLRHAVQLLSAHPQIEIEAKSKIYRTQSVEGGGPKDFLNAALRGSTPLTPRELLDAIQIIEGKLGRPQPPRNGPRSIDIDILLFGELEIQEANLTIPHPRMNRRAFVLKPLLDVLEGGWVEMTDLDWEEETHNLD